MNLLTDKLLEFALEFKTEDIPQNVIDFQKRVLVDSLGVMNAAATLEPAAKPFMDLAVSFGGGSSAILGTGLTAPPVMAAMANGALIHALDYEDGHDASHAHPNTASIPSILAFAQAEGKSGKETLAAMVIASEIAIRLKLSLTGNDLHECGWYSPPMFAAYGAVLGLSRLLGFTKEEALDALSICLTQISLPGQSAVSRASVLRGIREALSAKAAAFGAEMAGRGVKARMEEPLEGPLGIFMSCFRNMYDQSVIFEGLGTDWECCRLRFKAWPCCGSSHGVVSALSELVKEHDIRPDEVEEVHLHVNRPHMNLLEPHDAKYHPQSLAAAKFSLPFTVALVLRDGTVSLRSYQGDVLNDEMLSHLADLVTYEMFPDGTVIPKGAFPDDFIKVDVRTARGTFTGETVISPGSPHRPLTDEQIKAKFLDCCSFGTRSFSAEAVYDAIMKLDGCSDVNELFEIMND